MIAARQLAIRLAADVRELAPELLVADGIDLGPALEQHCYLRLAERRVARSPWLVSSLAPSLQALRHGVGAYPMRPDRDRVCRGAVLVQAAAHCVIWMPVAQACARRGIEPLSIVATSRFPVNDCHVDARISAFLDPRRAAILVRGAIRRAHRWQYATRGWNQIVDPSVADEIRTSARTALARMEALALQLVSFVDARCPPLLVAFAELSESSRVFSEVGRACSIPTLDLPHAEAADPPRLMGLSYDRVAVFGKAAAAVMVAANIPAERIVPIGAPHFDRLTAAPDVAPVYPRRIVYASQYLGGRMTSQVKSKVTAAAAAAAAALRPATLVVRRHPLESDSEIEGQLADPRIRDVDTVVAPDEPIERTLEGAWLLVTGWSNAVYEAALLGVPSITVNATGETDPMPFAAEGISVGVTDPPSAAAAASRLSDPRERTAAVAGARSRLESHLGLLDGRAAERAADLVATLLESTA